MTHITHWIYVCMKLDIFIMTFVRIFFFLDLAFETVFLLVAEVYYFAVIFSSFVLNPNLVFSVRDATDEKILDPISKRTAFFILGLLLVPKFVYPRTKPIAAAAAAIAVACLHFIVVQCIFSSSAASFHFIAINILFSCFLWISLELISIYRGHLLPCAFIQC